MMEIATAIQDGAKAYLTRQYKTVGMVAVIILVLMWLVHFSGDTIFGFVLGAVLSARCRICWHEYFRARQCAHCRSG